MRRSITLLAATIGALVAFAGPAHAQDVQPGDSGDPRAVSFWGGEGKEKNVRPGHCDDAPELAGGTDITDKVTATDDGTNVTITALPEGWVVIGVAVKGGPGYNLYMADKLGDDLPWTGLHAPINNSLKPAGLSHFVVCAKKDTSTTITVTAPVTTTEPGGTTTNPGGTTSGEVAPTTTPTPGTPGGSDDLPDTGATPWVPLLAGVVLLGGGIALLAAPRVRNALFRK